MSGSDKPWRELHGDEDWLKAERNGQGEDDNETEGDMLILARRKGERIMINDDIEIIIHDVDISKRPPQVKVGIQAPSRYVIDREEIYLKKRGGK